MLLKLLFLFSVLSLSLCSQTVPLPQTFDGIFLGQSNSTFLLEAHYDLLCPDSRDSYFALEKVLKDYDLANHPNFLFAVHIFPLPYHTYAHRVAIGEKLLQDNYGNNVAWEYVDLMFRSQESFYNGNISNLTINQLDERLAYLVARNLEVDENFFLSAIQSGQYDEEARISWKLGCTRTVSGAPFYFLNSIKVDDAPDFSSDDWVAFLQPFLNLTSTVSQEKGFLY